MDDQTLGIRPDILLKIYGTIEAQTWRAASPDIRHMLRISQDGKIPTKFYLVVSDKVAVHLLAAIQKQAESEYAVGLKSYLHKLQEQLMAQMFASASDQINIKFG